MLGLIQTISSFVLVLGVLIFVHEFGHFIVAKWLRISVPVFSLGLGPRLFGFRRGGTDYRISLVPLGGYVRMAGDEADEFRTGAPEEFLSRPKWQRFLVYVAGATLNILLAWLLVGGMLWAYGVDELDAERVEVVVQEVAPGSAAEASGVLVGDKLLSIAGRELTDPQTFEQVYLQEIQFVPDQLRALVVERDGGRIELTLQTGSDGQRGLGDPGWRLERVADGHTVIVDVLDGPAREAGLRPGDHVLGVEGRSPMTSREFRELVSGSPGVPLRLEVERDGRPLGLTVTPRAGEEGNGWIDVQLRSSLVVHRTFGPLAAAAESFRVNLEWSKTVFQVLRRWVGGDISIRAFSGPLEIAQVSREAVSQGLRTILGLLAFISLQLGILNLLPIPVLDGGHILILGVEGLMRRDLSQRLKERVMLAGLLALVTFFLFIIYFDIEKLIG